MQMFGEPSWIPSEIEQKSVQLPALDAMVPAERMLVSYSVEHPFSALAKSIPVRDSRQNARSKSMVVVSSAVLLTRCSVWSVTHSSINMTSRGLSEYMALRLYKRSLAASKEFNTMAGVRNISKYTTSPTCSTTHQRYQISVQFERLKVHTKCLPPLVERSFSKCCRKLQSVSQYRNASRSGRQLACLARPCGPRS